MPNYKILTEGETVFANLRRSTGEALQALHGEIVALFHHAEDDAEKELHDAAIAAHVEAGNIVATEEPVVVKAVEKVAQKSEDELKAEADLVAKTLADEKAAAESAAQQALLDAQQAAEAAKAKADAEAAAPPATS